MDEAYGQLPWTNEQWTLIQSTATQAARRSRVACTFLPVVGPLPPGTASIPRLLLQEPEPNATRPDLKPWEPPPADFRLSVDDSKTVPLSTISVDVYLTGQQVADPELSSARQMVARAAVILGRVEDALALVGQPGPDTPPTRDFTLGGERIVTPDVYRVSGGIRSPGLSRLDAGTPVPPGTDGENLITAVVRAIEAAEGAGQYGPFAAFLGHELYQRAHTPSDSLVLPADRFVPFLGGGPLLRSSVLEPEEGLIVASAGSPIEIVIAEDLHVSYVQRTLEPRYVLRLCERLVLRARQPGAVIRLGEPRPTTTPTAG